MAKKVIIDVDPGIDDALALAIALFDPCLLYTSDAADE